MSGTYDIANNKLPIQMADSEASDEEVTAFAIFVSAVGVAMAGAVVAEYYAASVAAEAAAAAAEQAAASTFMAQTVAENLVVLNQVAPHGNAVAYLMTHAGNPQLLNQVALQLNRLLPTVASSGGRYSLQCLTRIAQHMAAGGL
jgi:hypothetical protein